MTSNVLVFRLAIACTVLLVLHTVIGSLSGTVGVSPAGGQQQRSTGPGPGPSGDRAERPRLDVRPIDVSTSVLAAEREGAIRLAAAAGVAERQPATSADLETAERLSIRFQGLAELSGDYRIGADNMVSIPVVGRIALAGLSAADLERTLSKKTASISGREAFVTVEIAEHKPVFVTGLVQRPGTAPWKPGMTVLHALTIAGSASSGRLDQTTGTAVSGSPEVEHFRLRKAVLEQKRNLATMSRLAAERNGASFIELPESLVALVGPREAQRLVDEQAVLMLSRNQSIENQRAAIERAIATSRQEHSALQTQAANVRSQLDLRRSQKDKLDGLASKGWTRTDRVLDEQIRIIDLEEKGINIAVAMARVQGILAALERDRSNLIDDRRTQIDTEMLKLERDIAQVEVELEQIRHSYRMATGTEINLESAGAAGLKGSDRVAPAFEYSIVRQRTAGLETLKADQFTRVDPGDIVVVGMR